MIVLVLIVIGALIWFGYEPLAAVGTTVVIFGIAAWVAERVINDRNTTPPPSLTSFIPPVDPVPATENPLAEQPADGRQAAA
ncbi:hypothetical protein AB0I90_31650 [Micromonospora wenchangensis]|uniref:hypothetical protein n=1 Tax=Micromonospora TaxID=1873 RepID=UPI0033D21C7F